MKSTLLSSLLAFALLLGGTAAYADGGDASSSMEIAASLPTDNAAQTIDLYAPETLPEGVFLDRDTITVTAAGTYRLTGDWDGRVTADADGDVTFILAGVSLRGKGPLRSEMSHTLTLTAEKGTANTLSDGLTEPDSSTGAVLRAKGPLVLAGSGPITVLSGGGDGIDAKSGLSLSGGILYVNAAEKGIAAQGPVTVSGGSTRIVSGKDGIQSEDGRITAGTIDISGGSLSITCDGDGLQAQSAITLSGGEIAITSGGGGGDAINKDAADMFGPPGRGRNNASSEEEDTPSTKGIKSDTDITVSGGDITLSTADDSIHCARLCTIDGGNIFINAGDDAIHCDDMLVINGGDTFIYDCFEGLEAFAIEVHGGSIRLYSVNDCINANGSEWGGNNLDSISGYDYTYFWQDAGSIDMVVYSYGGNMGDGLDSNGSLYITGGHLTVSVPGTFMENGLDTGFGHFIISGGEVMAGGGGAMQETPTSQTDQCIAMINATLQADTTVYLRDSNGEDIWSYTFPNYTACVIVSHPAMTVGNTYTLTYGDTTQELDFTESNYVSVGGRGGRGGPGGGFPGGGFPGGPPPRPF